jgi:hypothetical protein
MPTTDASEPVLIPVSIGELIDKITILEIKAERVADTSKQLNIRSELGLLRAVWNRRGPADPVLNTLIKELKETNEALWAIEEAIRECERHLDFGPQFIELARAVYRDNDRRSALKHKINELSESAIVEEKFYGRY